MKKKTLVERLEALEAVAPRCGAGGCQVISLKHCEVHEKQWLEFRAKCFREVHNEVGAYADQVIYFRWIKSLNRA